MTRRFGYILVSCAIALWLGIFALNSIPRFQNCRYVPAQHDVSCKDFKDHRECRVAKDVPARQVWVCGSLPPLV
jgi:hypothetical protein